MSKKEEPKKEVKKAEEPKKEVKKAEEKDTKSHAQTKSKSKSKAEDSDSSDSDSSDDEDDKKWVTNPHTSWIREIEVMNRFQIFKSSNYNITTIKIDNISYNHLILPYYNIHFSTESVNYQSNSHDWGFGVLGTVTEPCSEAEPRI